MQIGILRNLELSWSSIVMLIVGLSGTRDLEWQSTAYIPYMRRHLNPACWVPRLNSHSVYCVFILDPFQLTLFLINTSSINGCGLQADQSQDRNVRRRGVWSLSKTVSPATPQTVALSRTTSGIQYYCNDGSDIWWLGLFANEPHRARSRPRHRLH